MRSPHGRARLTGSVILVLAVLDAWQYAWHRYAASHHLPLAPTVPLTHTPFTSHRYFHVNTFLYRHIHSWHHRLYVPYAFGALYNHPIEGFMFDSLGALVAHTAAGLTTRQAILFFFISTAKTVDDHCGFVSGAPPAPPSSPAASMLTENR